MCVHFSRTRHAFPVMFHFVIRWDVNQFSLNIEGFYSIIKPRKLAKHFGYNKSLLWFREENYVQTFSRIITNIGYITLYKFT